MWHIYAPVCTCIYSKMYLSGRLTVTAFTASIDTNVVSFHDGSAIIWDKVITSSGYGYFSRYSGTFTCNKAGLYVFNWNLMSGATGQGCIGTISLNGRGLLDANSQENGSAWEMGSNSIILHLTNGDRVWIKASQCNFLYGYPKSSFSGWKLLN